MDHRVRETHIFAAFFLFCLEVVQCLKVAALKQELVDRVADLVVGAVRHGVPHGSLLNGVVEDLAVVGRLGLLLRKIALLGGGLLGDFLLHDLNHYRFEFIEL